LYDIGVDDFLEREAGFASFLDYCKSQSTRAAEAISDEHQPLLQVRRLGASINFLNPLLGPPEEKDRTEAKCKSIMAFRAIANEFLRRPHPGTMPKINNSSDCFQNCSFYTLADPKN
jgi:hypothetical protein